MGCPRNLAFGKPVSYLIDPRPKYLELSKKGLTDGIFGGTTFVENWIGWEGTDGAFVIDLEQEKPIRNISTDFLKQLGAWILLPKQVSYSVSTDGNAFKEIACIDLPEDRGVKVAFIPVVAHVQRDGPVHPGGSHRHQDLPGVALRCRQPLLVLYRRGNRQIRESTCRHMRVL